MPYPYVIISAIDEPMIATSEPTESADHSKGRLARLQSFLESDPDNVNIAADLADLALASGDFGLARVTVGRVLDRIPDDPYFGLRMSSIAIAEGNFDEALALTESLILVGFGDVSVLYNKAFALFSLRRFAEAKDVLNHLRQEKAPYPLVVRMLIRSHHYLGELKEAIELALEFVAVHPGSHDVIGMLGLLYFDNGELELAGKWSQDALLLAPQNLDALLAAAGIALAAEDTDAVNSLMLQAVTVQPRNGRVWANLGLADLLNFDLNSAHDKLTQAVKYMPEHVGTWHILGWVQLLSKNIESAENSFQTALALDENFGETHGGLAAIAGARGDWAKAEQFSKIARRLDPDALSAVYAQILQLQSEGKVDLAQRLIKNALRKGKAPAGGNLLEMLSRIGSKPH